MMIFEFLKKKRSLLLKVFASAFFAWLIILALIPFLLSKGILEKQINKNFPGSIEIKKSRLSWFGTQQFEGVTLKDKDHDVILTIKSLKTSASFLSLLLGKRDFKEVSIDGLIGSIVSSKGQPSSIAETLTFNSHSIITQEKNKNRLTPIFILKKPFSGNFHIDNSSFLIQSQDHDPVYFNDIQISCSLASKQESFIAQLACETSQNDLSGSVNLKLEMGGFDEKGQLIFTPLDREIFFLSPSGYLNVAAQITNLPSVGVDHLLKFFNPKIGQIFSNAAGSSITLGANLHVVKEKSKIELTAHAHDLDVQFSGALKQNQFFLTQPSICRLNMRPALIANISQTFLNSSKLSIEEPAVALLQIDRLSTPLDFSNFNLNNLSCNAQFSLSPMKFIGDANFLNFEIKQIKGTIDTFDITDNLSIHLSLLAADHKKPLQFNLDGELRKLIDKQNELIGFDKIQAHFIAQAKDLPTKVALLFLKNRSTASEILGPSLNMNANFKGSLEAADIGLSIVSSRLNIDQVDLKMHKKHFFTLTNQAKLQLRATPQLAKKVVSESVSILHPFLLDGELKKLELSLKNKQFDLSQIDLELLSGPFDFIISDYKPCHVNASQAHFLSDVNSKVQLSLLTQVELPTDLQTLKLDKSVSGEFQLHDFIGYLQGSSSFLQTHLNATNWQAQLNGYLNKHCYYELLQEAQIQLQNPQIEWDKKTVKAPELIVYLNPCQLNLANIDLSTLDMQGQLAAKRVDFFQAELSYSLHEVKAPFEFNGKKNQCKLSASSKNNLESLSVTFDPFLKGNTFNFKSSLSNLQLNLKKLPPNLLQAFVSPLYDYESILGPSLDIELSSSLNKNKQFNGFVDFEIYSSILSLNGNFSFNENFQLGNKGLHLDYFMSPAGYVAVSNIFKDNAIKPILLEEPLHLKATFHQLSKNIAKNAKEKKLSFDGNFTIDRFITSNGGLHEVIGSLNSSDLARNLKFDLSAITSYNDDKGTAFISAELTDPLNIQNKCISQKINGSIQCVLVHFPTEVLNDFVSFNSSSSHLLGELLGSSFDLKCAANLNSGKGPLTCEVRSKNLSTQFALNFSKDHLTLGSDLHAQIQLSQGQTHHWLQKLNPLLLSSDFSTNQPIKIKIVKDDFYLPTSPYDIKNLKIKSAFVEVEKVNFSANAHLNKLLKFLKNDDQEPLEGWLTPICFSINDGIMQAERMDFLLNKKYHLTFWGNYNFNKDKADFYLALPSSSLKNIFGFENLSSNYFFQIPLQGSIKSLDIDWATATAQLCLLSISNSQNSFSQLLEVLTKSQPCTNVPKNKFTLPWEQPFEKEPPTPPSKKARSKKLSDQEQSEYLKDFIKSVRNKLHR